MEDENIQKHCHPACTSVFFTKQCLEGQTGLFSTSQLSECFCVSSQGKEKKKKKVPILPLQSLPQSCLAVMTVNKLNI